MKGNFFLCSVMIQDSQCKIIWAENWLGRAIFIALVLS